MQQKFKVEKKNYNLIILDLHMPIADGFEAIKNIKQLYEDNNLFKLEKECMEHTETEIASRYQVEEEMVKPIIIACSGLVNEEVAANTKEAGFDAVYQVPLKKEQIEKEIVPMIDRLKFSKMLQD